MAASSEGGRGPSAALIIAHGSRDAAATEDFVDQVRRLAALLPGARVRHAVLEFPGARCPSIGDAVADLVKEGVGRIVVLPFFLFDAGHVQRDIPAELGEAQALSPGLHVTVLPQVALEDGIIDALLDGLKSRGLESGSELAQRTAVLLVGAGTSNAGANDELGRVAHRLGDHVSALCSEAAFVSLAHPTVPEGVARCAARGARRIVTAHYFLNTGVLARRIEPQARAEAERLGVDLVVGEHFGSHQALTQGLARRLRRALAEQ